MDIDSVEPDNPIRLATDASLKILHDIRVMLWAGDYDAARVSLEELTRGFKKEIEESLLLRTQVIRIERRTRRKAMQQSTADSMELTASKRKTKANQLALDESSAVIQHRDELFILGAISGILSKIDKRISLEIGQPPLLKALAGNDADKLVSEDSDFLPGVRAREDPETGFRYMEIQRDDQRWEWRAYRPKAVEIDIRQIEEALLKIRGLALEKWGFATDIKQQPTWPYRYRGFAEQIYVEIVVLGPNRLKIEITAKQDVDIQNYLHHIFSAFGTIAE